MEELVKLELLVDELRLNALDDMAFAQRIARVCIHLLQTKADGQAAIETVFRLRQNESL